MWLARDMWKYWNIIECKIQKIVNQVVISLDRLINMINIHYQSKIILVDVPAIMAHVIWIIIPVIIVHTWIIILLWVIWMGGAIIDIGFYIGLFVFIFLIYDFYRTSIRIHIIHILIRCIHINIKINRTCIRTYWRNIRRRILIIVIVII